MIKINGKEVKTFNFSGGEVNPTLPEGLKSGPFKVLAYLQSSDDIMNLLMVIDAIKRNFGDYEINLTVPYLPYARQDRMCNPGEAIGINVLLKLLSGKVASITTVDAHNPNACKIAFDNFKVRNIPPSSFIGEYMAFSHDAILVAPDAGSTENVSMLAKTLGVDYIQGNKVRDTKTGKLSAFSVDIRGVLAIGRPFIIVDDICDGGGTFLGLHAELEKLYPKSVDLYVTHGIFSKGYDTLLGKFNTIYTTDTFLKEHDKNIKILKVIRDVYL